MNALSTILSLAIALVAIHGAAFPIPDNCLQSLENLGLDLKTQSSEAARIYHLDTHDPEAGFSGKVMPGNLPDKFRDRLESAPADWQTGRKVMVKVPRLGDYTNYNEWALVNDANVAQTLSRLDPDGLFLRSARDKKLNVLVMEDKSDLETLGKFLESPPPDFSPEGKRKIEAQLDTALTILKKAGLVHSDLNPSNILIDPKTCRICIIDFGIAAPERGYAPPMQHFSGGRPARGGVGEFMSQNQKHQGPGDVEDDATSVRRLKQLLQDLRR